MTAGIPRRTGQWSSSPGMTPGGRVQEVSGAIPGNSQLGVAGITNSPEGGYGGPGGLVFHQTRAEADPRGLVLHQGSVGVVLEAWYYTRAV